MWILPAMLASLAFLFFFSYVPFFQNTFLTRVSSAYKLLTEAYDADSKGVPVEHIFIPFCFAVGLLFMDETRKFLVRRNPHGFLARIAW
jgi:sodium/potassium-transporting ATPase subunit alpha